MYQLILVDNNGQEEVVTKNKRIQNIDLFTYDRFSGKDDLLAKVSEKYNKEYKAVYIKSEFWKNGKISPKEIPDVLCSNIPWPNLSYVVSKYTEYLLEQPKRLKESPLRWMPSFENCQIGPSNRLMISKILEEKMDNYRTLRDCYFQLINSGYLEFEPIRPKEKDYMESVRLAIDPDGLDPDSAIIIQQINAGRVEPYSVFDIDDIVAFVPPPSKGRRRR